MVCSCIFVLKRVEFSVVSNIYARPLGQMTTRCVPQQDNVGLPHGQDVFPDGDLDDLSSEDGTEFLAQAPRAFFALHAGDEAGGQRGVVVAGGGRGGSGRVGLPLGLARV